jgi:hypothetical protein
VTVFKNSLIFISGEIVRHGFTECKTKILFYYKAVGPIHIRFLDSSFNQLHIYVCHSRHLFQVHLTSTKGQQTVYSLKYTKDLTK